jgi:predicted DsbA family dithiol-disulfide isomerase
VDDYLKAKFGNMDMSASRKRLADYGKQVGVTFSFNNIVSPTIKSHVLIDMASDDLQVQDTLVDRVFTQYFEHGMRLNDTEALVQCASGLGGKFEDKDAVRAFIENKENQERVSEEARYYRQTGVSGVPFFIVRGNAFSGAQPASVFAGLFKKLLKKAIPRA